MKIVWDKKFERKFRPSDHLIPAFMKEVSSDIKFFHVNKYEFEGKTIGIFQPQKISCCICLTMKGRVGKAINNYFDGPREHDQYNITINYYNMNIFFINRQKVSKK